MIGKIAPERMAIGRKAIGMKAGGEAARGKMAGPGPTAGEFRKSAEKRLGD